MKKEEKGEGKAIYNLTISTRYSSGAGRFTKGDKEWVGSRHTIVRLLVRSRRDLL